MASTTSKRTFGDFMEANGVSYLPSTPAPSTKKPRSCSPSPKPSPSPTLWSMITALPSDQIQSLLFQASIQNDAIADLVRTAHAERIAEEAARPPVDFERYAQECWHTLNKKFAKLSCSKQFEMMGDICETLSDNREAVMQLAGPGEKWETRRNAVEVLCKICSSIMTCTLPQIRHEIMKDGMVLGEFSESIAELARSMTPSERERYKEEGYYSKLLELQHECEPDDMEGLQEIYGIFDGAEDSADEEVGYGVDEETSEIIAANLADPVVVKAFLNLTPKQPPAPLRTRVFSIADLS